MGADILMKGPPRIRGPSKLSGAPVMATDLRASMGLIIAGRGNTHTELSRVYHLDRVTRRSTPSSRVSARESSVLQNNEAARP